MSATDPMRPTSSYVKKKKKKKNLPPWKRKEKNRERMIRFVYACLPLGSIAFPQERRKQIYFISFLLFCFYSSQSNIFAQMLGSDSSKGSPPPAFFAMCFVILCRHRTAQPFALRSKTNEVIYGRRKFDSNEMRGTLNRLELCAPLGETDKGELTKMLNMNHLLKHKKEEEKKGNFNSI